MTEMIFLNQVHFFIISRCDGCAVLLLFSCCSCLWSCIIFSDLYDSRFESHLGTMCLVARELLIYYFSVKLSLFIYFANKTVLT